MLVIGAIFISLFGLVFLSGSCAAIYKCFKNRHRYRHSCCCFKNDYDYIPMVSNYEPKNYKPISV